MRLMQSKREPKSGCASAQDKEKRQPFHPARIPKTPHPPSTRLGLLLRAPLRDTKYRLRLRPQLQLQLATAKAIAPGPRLANKSAAWSMQSALAKILQPRIFFFSVKIDRTHTYIFGFFVLGRTWEKCRNIWIFCFFFSSKIFGNSLILFWAFNKIVSFHFLTTALEILYLKYWVCNLILQH